MTNPISNDGNLTQRMPAESSTQTRQARNSAAALGRPQPGGEGDTASVDRAQQRLTQETAQSQRDGPTSRDEASRLASEIRDRISADPRGALRSMNLVSDTLFEAATAQTA